MNDRAGPGLVAGVDVGGTFTDLVIFDPAGGGVRLAKVPTTLPNQAGGVLAAFDAAGADLADLDLIVHGTTTTTNAVLERRLSRTGLITTQGFRDVLELGRRTRPQAYGMHGRFTPVIPRDLRLEVPERMDARGRVLMPLDEDALGAAVRHLLAQGCESLVIHFLHAYANHGPCAFVGKPGIRTGRDRSGERLGPALAGALYLAAGGSIGRPGLRP